MPALSLIVVIDNARVTSNRYLEENLLVHHFWDGGQAEITNTNRNDCQQLKFNTLLVLIYCQMALFVY